MVKLLVTLLTSSKLGYLKQAVKCVENQLSNNLEVTTFIVVNTLKDDYYKKVVETFKNYKIIRTKVMVDRVKDTTVYLKFLKNIKNLIIYYLLTEMIFYILQH